MGHFIASGRIALAAAALAVALPAQAQLVTARDPQVIKSIVEAQGWPANLVTADDGSPYIESNRDGVKFLILFMNCDAGKDCKTLQYYMGFSDAKHVTPDRLNEWNKEKRFGRAYRDDEGDPVLEMDVDLDFRGIPRKNVVESFNTWSALMEAFRQFIFE